MNFTPTEQDLELAVLYQLQLEIGPSAAIRLMVEARERELGVPLEVRIDSPLISRWWILRRKYPRNDWNEFP